MRNGVSSISLGVTLALCAACSSPSSGTMADGAAPDAPASGDPPVIQDAAKGAEDATIQDASSTPDVATPPRDSGAVRDAGAPTVDGATSVDAGARPDATAADAAPRDAATDGGGAYKGVALYEVSTCPDLGTLNLAWYYNWTVKTGCKSNAQFVPHVWGHASEPIANEITQIVANGYDTVLGFNEPDNTGQSNMTVDQAIALWPQLDNAALRLGSPATQANTTGQAWFEQFMTQVGSKSLRVDFIAVHWYGWNAGSCDNANTLESYIKWAEQWKKPIWITEWACMNVSAPSASTVKTFYDAAIVMLKKHPLVERYGWYLSRSSDNNALVSPDSGALTPTGTDYAAAPAYH